MGKKNEGLQKLEKHLARRFSQAEKATILEHKTIILSLAIEGFKQRVDDEGVLVDLVEPLRELVRDVQGGASELRRELAVF